MTAPRRQYGCGPVELTGRPDAFTRGDDSMHLADPTWYLEVDGRLCTLYADGDAC
jgi:hypothetical protein